MKRFAVRKRPVQIVILIILTGFLIPETFLMPVKGATKTSFNQQSYWYYPWGKSGTHKGVDIFADKGIAINSATKGHVIYKGESGRGGKVVIVLGPKWRVHYYAHLDTITTKLFSYVNGQSIIGTVGNTGNAKGKVPHLHYSITTLFPYFWQIDGSKQGWKKMFYLNPITYLNQALS